MVRLTHWIPLSEKMAPEREASLKAEATSLHSAREGPEMGTGNSRQIFRHLTGNGRALGNMNSIKMFRDTGGAV